MSTKNKKAKKKQAVNLVAPGRYELRNFEFPDRPGQMLQFFERDYVDFSPPLSKEIIADGTSVDDVIKVVTNRLSIMDNENPCKENKKAIKKLERALELLAERRSNIHIVGAL